MIQRNEILNELKEISPLVAGIGNCNMFTVPDGYFATISDTVLICLKEGNPISINKGDKSTVPDNYFNTLASAILSKIKSRTELTVMNELKEISPFLAGISKTNPFKIPKEYFNNLQPVLLQADAETPPVLKGIHTIQPFELPAQYFDKLPAAIISNLQKPVAKVVSMPGWNNWKKYAAAAVITGLFSLGIFKYANNPVVQKNVQLAQLEPSIENGKNMDDKKFDELLNDLSEDDIAQYLEKNGSEADISLLTSSVDDNTLPNQEEYLLDNTTLDNFLQEINGKSLKN